MNRLKAGLILGVILLLAACGQSKKDSSPKQSSSPLIQMLMMAPADAAIPQEYSLEISYADLRATEQARPGTVTPVSMAAFLGMDETARRLWFASSYRQISTAQDLREPENFDAEMANYYGFDYFEIDRTLYFGPAPAQGAIYGGHFDANRVKETLTRRTYTATTLNGIPVLCGPVGCEKGADFENWLPDVGEIDPQSYQRKGVYPIFGGRLGRQEPIALPPGYLMASPDWQILGKMTAATAGTGKSLYDVPEFRAIADFAVTDSRPKANGLLIQVLFFQPLYGADFVSQMRAMLGPRATEEEIQALAAKYGLDKTDPANDLPVYLLGAMVDRQEGSDQVHSIVLVYANEPDAKRAADQVVKRVAEQSAQMEWGQDKPVIDLVTPEHTLESPQVIHHSATDRWLAVAVVRVPLPSNEPTESGDVLPSGRLFTAWYRTMMDRYFTPAMLPAPAQ